MHLPQAFQFTGSEKAKSAVLSEKQEETSALSVPKVGTAIRSFSTVFADMKEGDTTTQLPDKALNEPADLGLQNIDPSIKELAQKHPIDEESREVADAEKGRALIEKTEESSGIRQDDFRQGKEHLARLDILSEVKTPPVVRHSKTPLEGMIAPKLVAAQPTEMAKADGTTAPKPEAGNQAWQRSVPQSDLAHKDRRPFPDSATVNHPMPIGRTVHLAKEITAVAAAEIPRDEQPTFTRYRHEAVPQTPQDGTSEPGPPTESHLKKLEPLQAFSEPKNRSSLVATPKIGLPAEALPSPLAGPSTLELGIAPTAVPTAERSSSSEREPAGDHPRLPPLLKAAPIAKEGHDPLTIVMPKATKEDFVIALKDKNTFEAGPARLPSSKGPEELSLPHSKAGLHHTKPGTQVEALGTIRGTAKTSPSIEIASQHAPPQRVEVSRKTTTQSGIRPPGSIEPGSGTPTEKSDAPALRHRLAEPSIPSQTEPKSTAAQTGNGMGVSPTPVVAPIQPIKEATKGEFDASFLGVDSLDVQSIGQTSEQHRTASMNATQAAPRLDLPPHIPRQLAEVANASNGKSVDIALSPEELGRVKLSVTQTDHGVVVNILAERPDTLDLLRRHIDQLNQELKSLGYQNPEFSFSNEGDRSSFEQDHAPPEGALPADESPASASQSATDGSENLRPQTGLDIRL